MNLEPDLSRKWHVVDNGKKVLPGRGSITIANVARFHKCILVPSPFVNMQLRCVFSMRGRIRTLLGKTKGDVMQF